MAAGNNDSPKPLPLVDGQREAESGRQEEIKPVGCGLFGNIYDQFRGKAKEAIHFLLQTKEGDALGVFYRDDLGDIDLVWGSEHDNAGLAHIVDKHINRQSDFLSLDEAMNPSDLFRSVIELFQAYDTEKHLRLMNEFQQYSLSEHQFAQFLGKSRMYQCLPASEKRLLPSLEMTDSQINMIARNYYQDDHFARIQGADSISMWRVYNLLTGANKSSYIDNFLDRSLSASQLSEGLNKAIQGDDEYKWFIN